MRAGPFTPEVALTRPEALKELHVEFREAGAEVLQALTFYASRDKLATVGLQDRLPELNRAAVGIAREVAGDRCLVAGNISLTWMYEPGSPKAADRVRQTFDEQLAVQTEAGIDFVIGETFSFLGEALLAVECAKKTGLPVMVTVSFEDKPITTDGKTAAECAKALVDAGADIVGVNCLRGPALTLPLMEEMRKAVPGFLACQPVAYRTPTEHPDFTSLPAFPYELDPYQLTRKEMAEYAQRARDIGVNYIGACCGRWPSTSARWPRCSASGPRRTGRGGSTTASPCRPTSTTATRRRRARRTGVRSQRRDLDGYEGCPRTSAALPALVDEGGEDTLAHAGFTLGRLAKRSTQPALAPDQRRARTVPAHAHHEDRERTENAHRTLAEDDGAVDEHEQVDRAARPPSPGRSLRERRSERATTRRLRPARTPGRRS